MSAMPSKANEASLVTRERRYIQPGHLHVATTPTTIHTVLGSCVAVCLFDPFSAIGGMNHFMLPFGPSGTASPRFGSAAMEQLLAAMRNAGARLPFLRARVVGGSCMFAQMQSASHLGQKNVDLALDFLQRNHIEVVEIATGGNRGRKLAFNTDEGSTCLNLI